MKAKQHKRRRHAVIDAALTGGLAIFVGHEAVAQSAPPQPANLSSAIEDVIVTATRRQSTVEEIPYNISAVSGDALARTGTNDLAQLANQIPGFNFEDRGPRFAGSTVPIMRGLNASDTDRPGMVVEQMPVGTYIGNSPTVGFLPMTDLDRVEVLRGPQGTLYGAGSLGGAIRLIPNSPKLDEWSGSVEGSVGDTAHSSDTGYFGSVVLNAPLSPIAAIRISGRYEHQPGFIDQFGILARQGNPVTGVPVLANPADVANSPGVYYNKTDANYADVSSGRVSLLLQPSDALRAELVYNGSYVQGVNGDVDNPTYAGGPAPWDPRVSLPASGNYQIVSTTLAPYFRHTDLTSLDVSYDAGFATVSSTTTYGETSAVTGSDANTLILGLPATYLPYYTGNPINPRYVASMTDTDSEHRFTEEVRLVSKSGKTVDYVVGAFYEHDSRRLIWDIYEPGTTAQTIAAGTPLVTTSPDGHTFVEHAPQEFKETALFGEVSWHITPLWQLTGGGRFFRQTLTQDQDFTSYIIGLTGGNSSSNSISDHIFKVNTSYEFTDHQMVYATYSQGFRRGGVNAFPLSGFYQESPAILDYKPDKADNYETGIKGVFSNGLRYSADVFYINWMDPQIGISTPNTWPVAVNGKRAVSKGVELEIHTPLFTRNLNLTLGYSFTDAKLTEDFCLPVGDGTGNPNGFIACGIQGLNGERLPGTTENDGSATLSYTQALGSQRKIVYTLNANYRGSTLNSLGTIANNFTPTELPGYTLVNASVSESLTEHLRLGVYGSNLLDKRAVLGAPQRGVEFLGNLANAYTINRPREISLRVSYDW
jgi:outer membrane receptor protein involved in Fe transport